MTEKRLHMEVSGIVQGVGFRPFVFCRARDLGLAGWVRNTPAGVELELQGEGERVDRFVAALECDAPPLSAISGITAEEVDCVPAAAGFAILPSAGGVRSVQIAPDSAVCPDCLRELSDPTDRRYRYPFITCTNCGPRYSIVTGIPYDRPLTTMAPFPLCPACRSEYEDPADRRFHAQPVACSVCGPRLTLTDMAGTPLDGDPLERSLELLRQGKILAVKGIGGYHLAVDAGNPAAVDQLRRRKKRDEKPFALMVPDLAAVHRIAACSRTEELLLSGPETPIVLLRKREDAEIAGGVAPRSGYFGLMLPYAPLHHLLLDGFTALVMTSGNLSDEPVAYRDDDARRRLAGIADAILSHDREIHVRSDDSVIRVFRGNPLFIRRSRGYVPRPVRLPAGQPSVLAVGGELKGAVCLTRENQAFLSQQIGDLQNAATFDAFRETVEHLSRILEIRPELCAHDLHPDYLSTGYAQGLALPRVAVQHHHAHMAACMAEHGLEGETIGVVFDGTGFGTDGTIWGGEFLVGGYTGFQRHAHFRQVPLPGGDAAVREPYRMTLAYLYDRYGAGLFDLPLPVLEEVPVEDRRIYLAALERRINAPLTSSCGRLFDAVAALVGLRARVAHDGQAAMELEALAEGGNPELPPYPFEIAGESGCRTLDFRPTLERIAESVLAGLSPADIARRFHLSVALATAELCRRIGEETRLDRVVLSGGSFQNRLLSEGVCDLLEARGMRVYTHRLVPPNDGGLALGQAVIAGRSVNA